jgi:[acyl-carrier-protein] S-malonyltransferase
MAPVVGEYRAAVDATPMQPGHTTVVANISARPLLTVDEARDELAGQLTWPVRWTSSVAWMVEQGVGHFLEIGPKDVLAKLVKRIDGQVTVSSVGSVEAVQALPAA